MQAKFFKSLLPITPTSMFLYYQSLKKSYSSCNKAPQNIERKAICVLNSEPNQTAKGVVRFTQKDFESKTNITGEFTGLKQNAKHGFHIHVFGDLSQGCTTAGPHYNPFEKTHGGRDGDNRHVGDLGNVESDSHGNATYNHDMDIMLMGMFSVIGRSCVLHENEDDLGLGNHTTSKTTGNSGGRVACGVIGLTTL